MNTWEVANIIKAFSCDSCAKYACNGASIHSQCCDGEDACNCDIMTEPTKIEATSEEMEVDIANDCEGLCCNCVMRAHK